MATQWSTIRDLRSESFIQHVHSKRGTVQPQEDCLPYIHSSIQSPQLQRLQGDELSNVELLGALSAIAGIYVMHHDYKNMKTIVDKMYEVMHSIMQHSYQPGIAMLEAKYYLFYENNRDKATELYKMATVLAEAFGDEVFIKNLKMEMEKDLNIK